MNDLLSNSFQAISNFSFSSGVGNFQKSTATSYTDVAGNQQDGVLDTEFFTEYAKMQRLARPAMFAYPQSSNIDGYATKTAALQTKATKFSGLIVSPKLLFPKFDGVSSN